MCAPAFYTIPLQAVIAAVFSLPCLSLCSSALRVRGQHIEKASPKNRRGFHTLCNYAFLAISMSWVKAAGSEIASSESILRLISIPATFRPCMKLE